MKSLVSQSYCNIYIYTYTITETKHNRFYYVNWQMEALSLNIALSTASWFTKNEKHCGNNSLQYNIITL